MLGETPITPGDDCYQLRVLRPALQVTRRSHTVVSVLVPPAPAYSVSTPESLALALSPMASRAARGVRGAFELVVTPEAGSARLSDAHSQGALYLALDKSERHVRDQSVLELQLKLTGDTFTLDVGEDSNASALLIRGIASRPLAALIWTHASALGPGGRLQTRVVYPATFPGSDTGALNKKGLLAPALKPQASFSCDDSRP